MGAGDPRSRRARTLKISHIALPIVALLPVVVLTAGFYRDELGADPIETITHATGIWGLRLLLLTLCVTPLRKWTGWKWLATYRRSLGLLSFFYACLHFSTYLVFDLGFNFASLGEDILERPYITIGFATFLILMALALSSNRKAIRILKKRWSSLHRLVYLATVGAVIHFLWLVKADLREPVIYAAIAMALLAMRVPWRRITLR